jgi:hypothetical protein
MTHSRRGWNRIPSGVKFPWEECVGIRVGRTDPGESSETLYGLYRHLWATLMGAYLMVQYTRCALIGDGRQVSKCAH